MQVKHEVLSTTKDYFTLKLICYQAAGSGAETDYYYTIDLKTGKTAGAGRSVCRRCRLYYSDQ